MASTAIEKSICADEQLKLLDAELAKSYHTAIKQIEPEGEKAIVTTQRAWVADRNRRCATGNSDCLAQEYREREEILTALLARGSAENPVIDAADPAVLLGSWTVSSFAGDPSPSGPLTPVAAHLPPPGAQITARAGELCIVAPPQAKLCSKFGLAIEPQSSESQHQGKAPTGDGVTMLTYFDGKADFELVAGPLQELAATSVACEAAARNCRRITQRWLAASPDSTIKTFHLFTASSGR